jgi:hypothetical protein
VVSRVTRHGLSTRAASARSESESLAARQVPTASESTLLEAEMTRNRVPPAFRVCRSPGRRVRKFQVPGRLPGSDWVGTRHNLSVTQRGAARRR